MKESKIPGLDEFVKKYLNGLKAFQRDFLTVISKVDKEETFLKKNLLLLIDDLDFLIFLIENYPTKMNLASRFFIERMTSIRHYIASSGDEYILHLAKKALSSWKKHHDFYLNFILPLGDGKGFVRESLALCRSSYYSNLEILENNGIEIKDEWRSIDTVSPKQLKTIPIKNTIEQKLFKKKGSQSDRLSSLYNLYSELCHPNAVIECARISEFQDIVLITLLTIEMGEFLDLSQDYCGISK